MGKGRPGAIKLDVATSNELGIKIRYHPYGAAKEVFSLHDEEILMAGPAGTGKSLGMLQKVHLMLSKYAKAKGLMSRKTRTSMTNSCLDMFQRHVLRPQDRVHFHKQDQQFNYPNGSQLAVMGLDEPKRIMSTDFDVIYIQEATECHENDWEMATTRLRSHVIPYQQLLGDCNPDKPTHWLNKRVKAKKTRMLLSRHEDNPILFNHILNKWTVAGEKYRGKLERLSGVRRLRLYKGIWAAAEGMIYETWDQAIHMINRVDMPKGYESWPHYWSIDWGHVHPMVIQDWIEDPDTGAIYRNYELYRTGWLVEDAARYIKEKTGGLYIPRAVICDHDLEDRKVFERHTQYLTLPAYKHIQPGIQAVQARLDPNWNGTGKPGLMFIRDATDGIDDNLKADNLPVSTEEEMDGYVWDKRHNLEDANSKKDELPVDKDNHGCDAKRYIVAFLDNLAEDPEDITGVIELGEEVVISKY